MSPFTSASIEDHFSTSIRSTISRRSVAGFWISGRGLLEDFAEHPRLLAEFFKDVPVVGFEFVAFPLQQALPVELRRDDGRAVVRRLGLLVGHLEEEQERDLLRVGHVRKAIVPQNVGEVPGFVDDLLGVVAHLRLPCACFVAGLPLLPVWALIRSSSTLAGSSFGSWGTSLPSKARLRMAWRRRVERFRLAATYLRCQLQSQSTISPQSSAAIAACSANGGNGHNDGRSTFSL